MATYEQLLEAAGRAHKAGDEKNARILVQEALKLKPAPKVAQEAPQALAAVPPRADAPTPPTQQVDRFGDTIAAATAEPRAALGAFAGGLADQSQSPTMAALPDGMNPRLKGMAAGLGDLAGAGVSTLGVGFGAAAGLAGEMFGGSPTNEMKLARDLTMMGQVAVPELAGVSGAARVAGAATKAPAIVEPSLAMRGKTGAMAAAVLEKNPLTAGMVAKDAARAVGQVADASAAAVSRVGIAGNAERAGEILQKGLKTFVANFQTKSTELYNAVSKKLPSGYPVRLTNTQKAMDETKALFAGNPVLAKKLGMNEWDAVLAEAQANGISWGAVQKFRSSLGEAIGSNRGSLADEDVGRLKLLYGSLTQDMEAAAKAAGPEAYRAWKRANSYYKAGADRIENALDKTITASSPERAYEAFVAATKADRATSDITRLRRIKSSMKQEEWNTVSASVVDRLGKSPAGQQGADGATFSPSVFLTEWNKMTPEARKLLLPDDVRAEFEALAKVAEKVKTGNLERNTSGTGLVTTATALGAGAMQAPVATAFFAAGSMITAKALTSPIFMRAVGQAGRGTTAPLIAMARGNGPFAQDARTLLTITGADAAAGNAANSTAAPLSIAK